MSLRALLPTATLAVSLAFASTAQTQQFVDASGNLPGLGLATEATKFGDFDLDGDLDLVYANGGDSGNQQSRLLVNNGLAQGGVIGTFTEVTAAKLLPNFIQSSRDVQVVDIDNDGDFDFYFSNHSQQTTQSNTWFINQGGAQGGSAGTFQRDMTRWFQLGTSGSSLPVAQVITSGNFAGGFQDWSCQCEFADSDLDGDMDLLHSSYGSAFNATVMTRLFLNGSGTAPLGFFKEYNPSGAVSGNPGLPAGSAAGHAEGVQANNTTDVTGAQHDLTNMSLDVDFADIDGDLDNDIQQTSRDTQNRVYQNRYFENGASLGSEGAGTRHFRDVTGSALLGPGGLAQSSSNYDSEVNDLDNDNDVDLYFINYSGAFIDFVAFNNGAGAFQNFTSVPGSGNDDNEIDMIDHDYDGDVDVFISAFRGADRFYKNQFVETGSVNLQLTATGSVLAVHSSDSLAADVGDADNDGDPDIVFAEDATVNEVLLRNTIDAPDPIAPRVPRILQIANAGPSAQPRLVVAQAFDNINFEYFHNATATLNYAVNGAPHSAPAHFAGGNLFRATIPGYWTGTIIYSMAIQDRVGNAGTSPIKSVSIAPAGASNFGTGTPGCSGPESIGVNSAPTAPNPDFALTCTHAPASALGLGLIGNVADVPGSDPLALGITLHIDLFFSTLLDGFNFTSDPSGFGTAPLAIPNSPSIIGQTLHAQALWIWSAGPCAPSPFGLSTSDAVSITFLP